MSHFSLFLRGWRRLPLAGLLLSPLFGCHPAAPAAAQAPTPSVAARGSATPAVEPDIRGSAPAFECNLLLGVAVTSEWFEGRLRARGRRLARWESLTKPPPPRSSGRIRTTRCGRRARTRPARHGAQAPDRVLFTAMNWEYTTAAQWQNADSLRWSRRSLARFPSAREIDLLTMIARAGQRLVRKRDEASYQPFVDEAIRAVASQFPDRVRVGPKLEVPSCALFKDGGPHFTDSGRSVIAQLAGNTSRARPNASRPQVRISPRSRSSPLLRPSRCRSSCVRSSPPAVFDIRDFGAAAGRQDQEHGRHPTRHREGRERGRRYGAGSRGPLSHGPHSTEEQHQPVPGRGRGALVQPGFRGLLAARIHALGGHRSLQLFAAHLREGLRERSRHRQRHTQRARGSLVAVEKVQAGSSEELYDLAAAGVRQKSACSTARAR